MNLDYLLTGVIDGTYTEVAGTGTIDQTSGELDIKLDVRFAPPGWDPAIIILICCDNLRLFTAKLKKQHPISTLRTSLKSLQFGNLVNRLRDGYIQDEKGNYIVGMKAKGFLFVEGNNVKSRTVIVEGFSKIDKFGGVKNIFTPYQERIIPTGNDSASGISTYKLECNDGTVLHGHTHYPYVFHDGQKIDDEVVLEVTQATTNSVDFLQNGAVPQLNVKIEQK